MVPRTPLSTIDTWREESRAQSAGRGVRHQSGLRLKEQKTGESEKKSGHSEGELGKVGAHFTTIT